MRSGWGWWGSVTPAKRFHAPLIGGTPGMALKAVASSDADKVHADWPGVKVMSAPGDLLDDPDIDLVVIATPNDTHFPLAKARWRRESMLWWISPLP